jgi:3-oxoacyl-[acyl-carrier-protein] synthase I
MTGLRAKNRPLYLPALGIACSLGRGKQAVVDSLFAGQGGFIKGQETLLSGKVVPVARVPFRLDDLPDEFKDLSSRNNALLRLALDEVSDAVQAAKEKYGTHRIGVILGTSTSGMLEGEQGFIHKKTKGTWPDHYHYSQQEVASPSSFVLRYFGLTGPAYTISTACSSGSKAMISAARLIQAGICDVVICGGVDSLCQLTINGFDALELLSKKICNPFSKNRDGITIGEGAAVFIMSAEYNNSEAAIEFLGGGESTDAYHISSPDPNGEGAESAIREALKIASLEPTDIVYINLHGTATRLNDAMESYCISRIFGSSTPCSSTKALTGHTLGAAGAIEAAFLWLSLLQERDGTIPLPTHIWDQVKDEELAPIQLVARGDRAQPKNDQFAVMSNSFAFGGNNVSLILSKKRALPENE